MKIVHVSPHAPYNDYWGYQENLLPKYQKRLGYEVAIIVTTKMHKNGVITKIDHCDYLLNDGTKVLRRDIKQYENRTLSELKCYMPVYDDLLELMPDYVFFHSLISTTVFDVIKYKKNINPNCIIVQDNHLDYNIGFTYNTVRQKIVRQWYRLLNRMSVRYVDKVYGVTPWRKEYAEIYFQIPPHKTDVLIMGADDDMVDLKNRDIIRENVRRELNMLQGERLVVTGGKIDKKKNIIALMEACTKIKNIKLLVFGNLLDDIREEFETLLKASSNIIYIGWVDSSDVYKYFFASDLVVFPGQHSVLWEQACAAKTPCLFKRWNGMEHVNNGGNSEFMDDVSAAGIGKIVQEILFSEKIEHMTKIASSSATDIFMYSEIAKKSVECFEETKV